MKEVQERIPRSEAVIEIAIFSKALKNSKPFSNSVRRKYHENQ
jgi:hypothetical protein